MNNNRPLPTEERMTGNSTRLADWYIQELFTSGSITVKDHINHIHSDADLFNKIYRRLRFEHNFEYKVLTGKAEVNEGEYTIKLINK